MHDSENLNVKLNKFVIEYDFVQHVSGLSVRLFTCCCVACRQLTNAALERRNF